MNGDTLDKKKKIFIKMDYWNYLLYCFYCAGWS